MVPLHTFTYCTLTLIQACFTGGAFALACMHSTGERKQHFRKLAEEITRTCHESYNRTGKVCSCVWLGVCALVCVCVCVCVLFYAC